MQKSANKTNNTLPDLRLSFNFQKLLIHDFLHFQNYVSTEQPM